MAGYSRCSRPGNRAGAVWLAGWAGVAALLLSGCGPRDRHYVTGTVRFPDGSPLTDGRLVISYGENALLQANAYVQPDGSFRVGEIKDGDGMRAGTVGVGVMGLTETWSPLGVMNVVYHCDPKYFYPETSGLVFEVPKQLHWEIVVERPSAESLQRLREQQKTIERAEQGLEKHPPPGQQGSRPLSLSGID